MVNKNHLLWAPDIIKESNGIACGDMLSLSAYREKDKLFFRFHGNACRVALKVAEYLVNSFSGKSEFEIMNNLERLRSGQYKENEQWMTEYYLHRKDCVESPISLLYGIIGEKVSCDISTRDKTVLACDACVSTKPINWKPTINNNKETSLREIAKELKMMDNPTEIEFQKFGLCVLDEEKQKQFSVRLDKVSDRDFKLIKKLRLAVLLFNNARKYNLSLDKRIEELAVKQIVSLNVANEEIKIIDKWICMNELRIDAVKGGKTNKYYPAGSDRTHMDFDYLAAEFEDAFKFISYLINERKFKLVIGGSVPFSLKAVLNTNVEEVLTGHIHLEKIVQDKYQVVVDVNMGGFPLGRTGIIQCNKDGKVELEDLICITVAHLFKHEHVFMKDINDLYYLLSSQELNKLLLVEKLRRYELSNLFSVVYKFLKNEINLDMDITVGVDIDLHKKRIDTWPFSRKSHFYIKAKDMLELNVKQFGKQEGRRETINQICGVIGEITTVKYSYLTNRMNERVYLYPVAIFSKYMDEFENEKLIYIAPNMFRSEQLLVLPIGLFLIQNDSYSEIGRNQLNDQIENLINVLGMDESICNVEYVMEVRKDTWLY